MAPADSSRSAERPAVRGALRSQLLLIGGLSAATNLLMLVPTLYLLQVFDRVLTGRNEFTLLAVSLLALLLFAIMAVCEWARTRVLAHGALRLQRWLAEDVFGASFDAYLRGCGAEAARAWADLQQVRQVLAGPSLFVLFDLPWTPVYVLAAYLLHPMLGAVAVGFVVLQALLAWAGRRDTAALVEAASRAASDTQAFVHARLRHAEAVEAMGMLANLRQHWRGVHGVELEAAARAQRAAQHAAAASKFVRHVQQSLTLAAGAVLVIRGDLSPSAMIAANLLVNRALVPIDQLAASWRPLLAARSAYRRVRQWAMPSAGPQAAPSLPLRGAVLLRSVTARVAGRDAAIVHIEELAVAPGTLVAITGPSGAGKSTLARVLVGAWPQVEGEVLLDGRPVAGLERSGLGPHVGYLPQDVELFDGTIAENIARLGEVDAPAVTAAARAAGLHELILRYPSGYDTRIGEGGRLLSGGQRQRIGLARALYRVPRLVVLDEPGANLDSEGEAALRAALLRLKGEGTTVFVVTHPRGGLLALADQILVLHDGQVKLQGEADAVLAILRAAESSARAARAVKPASQPASG